MQSITKKWIALALILSFSFSILLPGEVALAIDWGKPEKAVSKLLKQSPGFEKKANMADLAKEVNLGVPFVVNEGQKEQNIAYYTDISMGSVAVTHDGQITYDLVRYEEVSEEEYQAKKGTGNTYFKRELTSEEKLAQIKKEKKAANHKCEQEEQFKYEVKKESKIEEILLGANKIAVTGADQAVTKVNCFTGKNQQDWRTNLATYHKVKMGEIYPGIELTLKATGSNVEKVFTVNPGGNPKAIQIEVAGATSLVVNEKGQLTVNTNGTPLTFTAPVAYQEINGKTINVPVAYSVQGTTYGFTIGEYDQTQPLIIDPLLDIPYKPSNILNYNVSDSQGNVYNYSSGNGSLTISKYNNDLSELLASTTLNADSIYEMVLKIDSSDNIYLGGVTSDANFPCTLGAYSTEISGNKDVFVTKFNTNLEILASTFLGGTGYDRIARLEIDSIGNVLVAGSTSSSDFPTTSGAFSRNNNGLDDIFISKLNADLTTLQASTLYGSDKDDYLVSLVLDEQNNVYLSGYVGFYSPPDEMPEIPLTQDAYQNYWLDDGGIRKGFITKFNANLNNLTATTLVDDRVSIALDQEGNVLAAVYPFILQKYTPNLTEQLVSKGQKLSYMMFTKTCG